MELRRDLVVVSELNRGIFNDSGNWKSRAKSGCGSDINAGVPLLH